MEQKKKENKRNSIQTNVNLLFCLAAETMLSEQPNWDRVVASMYTAADIMSDVSSKKHRKTQKAIRISWRTGIAMLPPDRREAEIAAGKHNKILRSLASKLQERSEQLPPTQRIVQIAKAINMQFSFNRLKDPS